MNAAGGEMGRAITDERAQVEISKCREPDSQFCVQHVMAAYLDDDPPNYAETLTERSARLWKKAALMYRRACGTETPEVRKMYMQVAMSWAALANELGRAVQTPVSVKQRDDDHPTR